MSDAKQQNAMMLASLLGIGEDEASEKLQRVVLITAQPGWKSSWAVEVAEVLGRTVSVLMECGAESPDLELVIGDISPRTAGPTLQVDLDARGLVVSMERAARAEDIPHGLYRAAAACAVSAAAVRTVIDEVALPEVRLPMRLDFAALGVPVGALEQPVEVHHAVIAGAGAVAHGFLHAARHLDLRGDVVVVDPKVIQGGILNRCLYLREGDAGKDKARILVERAQAEFQHLILTPVVADFRSLSETMQWPPETVFVTVDSRAVRRSIQLEVPHRIVDASTTDARGVIVHSNTLPSDHACLACIYRHVPEEHAREKSVAEGLGIDLATVQRTFIDREAALRIVAAHSSIDPDAIIGVAFDSLFRQLCGQQALSTPEGRQVLAPFAFVSAWAGVLLTVEMLRVFVGEPGTNYWSVDPWNVPVTRARVQRGKHPECQLCSSPDADRIIQDLWGNPAASFPNAAE